MQNKLAGDSSNQDNQENQPKEGDSRSGKNEKGNYIDIYGNGKWKRFYNENKFTESSPIAFNLF